MTAPGTKQDPVSFGPGEKIPTPGIYRVHHYQHRMPHLTTLSAAIQVFPSCRICRERVRFEPYFEVSKYVSPKNAGGFAPDVEVDCDFPEENKSK